MNRRRKGYAELRYTMLYGKSQIKKKDMKKKKDIRKKSIKKILRYHKAIDGFNRYSFILDLFFRREKIHFISIGGTSVYVRNNTADINVAISGLFYK